MADWSHQERAVQAIDQAIADGHKKICLASPTGSGKSRILFEHLCRHEMKTVVHTDRIMLKDQLSTEMEKHDISHALQASGHDTEYARIQLAMVQTLVSRYLKQGRPLHDARS